MQRMGCMNSHKNQPVSYFKPPVDQGSTIVEFGPGHGFALRRILEKRPERVYGVEISESFRSILESDPDFRCTYYQYQHLA